MSEDEQNEALVKKEMVAPVPEVPEVIVPSPSGESMIDKLNAATNRAELANKATELLIRRQEEAKVQNTLGGESSAGAPQTVLSADEKADAEAKKFLGETGYGEVLFPVKKDV